MSNRSTDTSGNDLDGLDPVTFQIIKHRLVRVTDEAVEALGAGGGAPERVAHQFHAVAGGVAHVQRALALVPLLRLLHRHVVPVEVAPPRRQLIGGHPERDVDGPVGPVRRQRRPGAAGRGVEDVDDAGPAVKGDVVALGAERHVQPQHVGIELLGGRQVVGVEAGFEDEAGGRGHVRLKVGERVGERARTA